MGVDDTLLSEIVRRVLTVTRPDKVILFGSAATGQMTKDSNIDLLIVGSTATNRHEASVQIRDAIGNVQMPVDLILIATERFEVHKGHPRRHRLSGVQVRQSAL